MTGFYFIFAPNETPNWMPYLFDKGKIDHKHLRIDLDYFLMYLNKS